MQRRIADTATARKLTNSFYRLSVSILLSGCAVICTASAVNAQEAPPANSDASLPPVTVQSTANRPRPAPRVTRRPRPATAQQAVEPPSAEIAEPTGEPTTSTTGQGRGGASGVDGYQATRSSSATKTDTPWRDVPQAATIITKELAKDQGSRDLNSALRYVPGIHVQQGEGHRDAITIRGQTTTADFYTDGVRDDVQYFRDIYNVDVIEVLKGPNAMIFGRGGGGGVVNRVTKKAEFEDIREATVTFGSFDTKRVAIDVGAAATPDFAVRLNTMYEDSGGFRDFYYLDRYGINPSMTARLSDQTTLRMSYEYFVDDRFVDRGVPSYRGTGPAGTVANPLQPSRPPRERFFGDPALSFSEFEAHIVTATLEHKFDNGIKLRNHTSYGDYDKYYSNAFANSAAVGAPGAETVPIAAYFNDTKRESFFNQTDLTVKLDHGNGLNHTIVAGVEVGVQDTVQFRYDARFPAGSNTATVSVPFATPVTTLTNFGFTALQNNAVNDSSLQTTSVYVQDQLELSKYFQVIGGLRFERFDLDYNNLTPTPTVGQQLTFNRVDEVWSPRVGAIFKPFEELSLYVSHSKSFLPYSGDQFASLNASTSTLSPEEFINNEVGFKWDVLPRLNLAGAIYQLDRENTIVPTAVAGVSAQVGLTRTEGGEISLTGYATNEWQISMGYGYQDAELVETGVAATEGNVVPMTPKHLFSVWNRYDFTNWFGAGLGVIHSTEFFPAADNTVVVPGYTRLDAALFFEINENYKAQLNVENLVDETYFISAHNNNNISYGAPRTFLVTVTGNF